MNDDGIVDIIGAHSGIGVRGAPGDGASFGTFQTTDLLASDEMEVGDLNGDMLPDVMTFANGIRYVLNQGGGVMGPQLTLSPGTDFDRGRLVDIDDDGDIDIIASSNFGGVGHFLNDGTGTFASFSSIGVEGYDIDVGYIDSDGDIDIAVSATSWYENLGAGVFSSSAHGPINFSEHLKLEDLDGDGNIELVHAHLEEVYVTANILSVGCTDPLACNFDPNETQAGGYCCFGICGCTDSLAQITLFPNPMTQSASMDLKDIHGLINISVYDAKGSLVRKEQARVSNGRVRFNRHALESGSYIMIVRYQDLQFKLNFVVE